MFKRANKVTALLVAAASVMTMVPAMAATKLSNKDGTVKQGISFEDGQYSYYGYRTDDDDTGIWYNKGGEAKDSRDSDLEDYAFDNSSKFGTKYAFAKEDNGDEYEIDLTTGKIVSDDSAEDKLDKAKDDLASAMKKADRYQGLKDGSKVQLDGDFERVLTGQFGDVWYQYTTSTSAQILDQEFVFPDNGATSTTAAAVILTNEDKNYIDASVIANMQIFSSKKGRAVKVEKFDKKYDDAALAVHLESIKVLAQDKDYLYTLTTVTVNDSSDKAAANKAPDTQYFIQKISKARSSSKEDGAYVPKDVTSYQLNKDKQIYDNGDMQKAYEVIAYGDSGDGYSAANNLYTVKDGTLYVSAVKKDKVKVWTLKLGKFKEDTVSWLGAKDVDFYAVKKTGDSDHDTVEGKFEAKADDSSVTLSSAVAIDTEGFTYALDKGKIFKYDGSDWKQLYSVDRATDSIDVYNEGNLIAWDSEGDAYTTVQEGKKGTVDDALAIDPNIGQTTGAAAKVGWDKQADGTWNFYDINGVKQANFWANDNGTWYWIKADGVMAANEWAQVNGVWYYLTGSGAMARGWTQVGGSWYYLNSTSGAMATGWLNDNGTWYYLTGSGAMAANTTVDGYVLGANGAWVR